MQQLLSGYSAREALPVRPPRQTCILAARVPTLALPMARADNGRVDNGHDVEAQRAGRCSLNGASSSVDAGSRSEGRASATRNPRGRPGCESETNAPRSVRRARRLRHRLRRRHRRAAPRARSSTRLLEGLCRVRHRGAIAADRRTGDGAGLLLPIPDALRPEAGRRARDGLPARRIGADATSRRPAGPRVSSLSAGGRCRSTRTTSATRRGRRMPRIEQLLLAAPAGALRRRGRVARLPRAPPRRARGRRLHRLALLPHRHLQGALRRRRARRLLPRPRSGPISRSRSASSTSASRRTRRPPGSGRSRSASSATTARSTRSRATSTGCAPARATSAPTDDELYHPVLDEAGSDSAMLDNALDFVVHGGRDVRHALSMLVPARLGGERRSCPQEVRDFYRYHAGLVEPWDGPAGHRLHRRPRRRRRPRPQRPAPAALRRLRGRPRRLLVRGRGRLARRPRQRPPREARPRPDDRQSTPSAASRRTTC